jgi:hypothetical protein
MSSLRSFIADVVNRSAQTVEDTASSATQTVEDTASSVAQTVSDTASSTVQTVEDTASSVTQTVSDAASSTVQTVEDTASSVTQTVSDAVSSVTQTAQDTASSVVQTVEDTAASAIQAVQAALASGAPVINFPGMGEINLDAALTQAANQVVANNTPAKLPFLERAAVLLEEARRILEGGLSPDDSLGLPPATVGFSGKCCTRDELLKFRAGLEAPRNSLQGAINAYNDTQRAIEDAAAQGKKICYGALGTCLLGLVGGAIASQPAAGVAACFAGCVACIAGATPVQNAIRTQIKAKADVEAANGVLERALGNHLNCYNFRCPGVF